MCTHGPNDLARRGPLGLEPLSRPMSRTIGSDQFPGSDRLIFGLPYLVPPGSHIQTCVLGKTDLDPTSVTRVIYGS